MISQASGSAYAEFGHTKVSRCCVCLQVMAGKCATRRRLTLCHMGHACRAAWPFTPAQVMVGVYGPRQSERRVEYSEQGRINVDVKLASFATRQRGIFGQVRGLGAPLWASAWL